MLIVTFLLYWQLRQLGNYVQLQGILSTSSLLRSAKYPPKVTGENPKNFTRAGDFFLPVGRFSGPAPDQSFSIFSFTGKFTRKYR